MPKIFYPEVTKIAMLSLFLFFFFPSSLRCEKDEVRRKRVQLLRSATGRTLFKWSLHLDTPCLLLPRAPFVQWKIYREEITVLFVACLAHTINCANANVIIPGETKCKTITFAEATQRNILLFFGYSCYFVRCCWNLLILSCNSPLCELYHGKLKIAESIVP